MTENQLVDWIQSQLEETENGCLEWTGSTNTSGYGHMFYKGTTVRIHRFLYIITYDLKIDERDFILHKCHNKLCCNIDHLYLGNHEENMQDLLYNSDRYKLKKEDVEVIRKSKMRTKDLAEIFNVSDRNIYKIRMNETWKFHILNKVNERSIGV